MNAILCKFINYLKQAGGTALDFILPPRCPATGDVVDAPGMVSPGAWDGLRFIAAPVCACCGLPFGFEAGAEALCLACLRDRPPYASARAALAYDDGSRNLILRFKHADQTHVVFTFIPWLKMAGRDMLATADVIIPVPLHRGRLLKRRYNQAALLADALSRATKIKWLPHTLRRHKATTPQGFMTARARLLNVKRAFAVPESRRADIAGKNIVLVDDVYTTGATVIECTKTLLAAGAAAVHILTIARVVRE
ncbi:MAG: ComF family protein [Alphaproteobacteria bacterium]|nr:ComF family protein [Alphaproteobacteria bacterium]MBU0859898.1 ComF family protein [Alphaproteobacteria bacterium]